MIDGSLSSRIAGFHPTCRFSQSFVFDVIERNGALLGKERLSNIDILEVIAERVTVPFEDWRAF
jgi:hypothetical protein